MSALFSRRDFFRTLPALTVIPSLSAETATVLPLGQAELGLRITEMEVIGVRATMRTNWIFVRLTTNDGQTGLGEASVNRRLNLPELSGFFNLVRDRSPFEIERYRQAGWATASTGNRQQATAFSAIEQAQWDLVGKSLGAPVYDLVGGRLRDELPVYANINRATTDRSPNGFAISAQQAVADGFRAIKAAPFDGFPSLDQPRAEVEAATELGVHCIEAMRTAIGPDIDLKIDAHSHFDVALAIDVATRLEPQRLSWYEEPVPPTDLDSTMAIKNGIRQTMAGGEFLFGVEEFSPLCQNRAVDIIMPDVKHCGGVAEIRRIATVADLYDVLVSPHNPSGPVSTMVSAQVCAGLPNFDILEYQWNEVPWRGDLVDPPERFSEGILQVPDGPGYGVTLNNTVVREHT
ncbi:MAG: mandelate racemase/muconate lactonizing enzyme family protein [Vicinamibacterales bacterium]